VNVSDKDWDGNIMGARPGDVFGYDNLHQMLLWMSGRGLLRESGRHQLDDAAVSGNTKANGW
jgi:hypothetical protein